MHAVSYSYSLNLRQLSVLGTWTGYLAILNHRPDNAANMGILSNDQQKLQNKFKRLKDIATRCVL